MSVTVAIDAMGGDRAPGEIVAGAVQAAEQLDVARAARRAARTSSGRCSPGTARSVELVAADRGGRDERRAHRRSARRRTRRSCVCAQLVRDGKADAMVSAGNTGATMAAALLRIGRIKGVARPAIAAPIPVPGSSPADPRRRRRHRRLLARVARAVRA